MGPGTHLVSNIINDVQFTNHNDHVSLHHDLDFLRANGDYQALIDADIKAIRQSDNTFSGLLLKTGLTIRSIVSTLTRNYFNLGGSTLTDRESKFLADYLAELHNAQHHN